MKNPSYRSIIKESFDVFFQNIKTLLGVAFIFTCFSLEPEVMSDLGFSDPAIILYIVCAIIAYCILLIVLILLAKGESGSLKALVEKALPSVLRIVGTQIIFALIVGLLVGIAFLGVVTFENPLLFIPVGGVLFIAFFYLIYCTQVVVCRKAWGLRALALSYEAVRGHWWWNFFFFIFVMLISIGLFIPLAFFPEDWFFITQFNVREISTFFGPALYASLVVTLWYIFMTKAYLALNALKPE